MSSGAVLTLCRARRHSPIAVRPMRRAGLPVANAGRREGTTCRGFKDTQRFELRQDTCTQRKERAHLHTHTHTEREIHDMPACQSAIMPSVATQPTAVAHLSRIAHRAIAACGARRCALQANGVKEVVRTIQRLHNEQGCVDKWVEFVRHEATGWPCPRVDCIAPHNRIKR